MDSNPDLSRRAFHIYTRNSGFAVQNCFRHSLAKTAHFGVGRCTALRGTTGQQGADGQILMQLLTILGAFGKPAAMPRLIDSQAHPDWMNFSTHDFSFRP